MSIGRKVFKLNGTRMFDAVSLVLVLIIEIYTRCTYIYVYIYIYMFIAVCMCMYKQRSIFNFPGGAASQFQFFMHFSFFGEVFHWMRIGISSRSCVFRGRELRFGADSWKTRFSMKKLRNQIMRPAGRIFVIWFLKFYQWIYPRFHENCFFHESASNRSSRPLNTQLLLEISIRIQWKTSPTPNKIDKIYIYIYIYT